MKKNKDKIVCVRFNPEDVKMINSIATEYGTTVSDVIRTATEGQLSKYLGSVRFVDAEQGNKIHNCAFDMMSVITETRDYLRQLYVSLNQLNHRTDLIQDPDMINRLMQTKNGIKEQFTNLDTTVKEAGDVILSILS